MQRSYGGLRESAVALSVAALLLSGCVCDDAYSEFEVALLDVAGVHEDLSDCDASGAAELSNTEAAKRADPDLLSAARSDAQNDCYAGQDERIDK